MLQIVHKFNAVDLHMLKLLYRERIEENRVRSYSKLSAAEGSLSAEQDFYYDIRRFLSEDGTFYALLNEDGCYRSAMRLEKYADGYLIAGLETEPTSRGRGYAKKLLRETTDYLKSIGCSKIYSHVSLNNKASLAVHYTNGFHQVCDHAVFIDGTISFQSITLCKKIND